jgi:hypothetical protein
VPAAPVLFHAANRETPLRRFGGFANELARIGAKPPTLRDVGTVLGADTATGTADAVVAISARLNARRDTLADRIVGRICSDIPDYRLIDDEVVSDVRSITLGHIELIVDALIHDRTPSDE